MSSKQSSAWKAKANHLVLLALKNGSKHGYEITKHVKSVSNGYFSLGYSSLYPTLHALEKEGMVIGEWESNGAKDKKVYKLTRKGWANLKSVNEEFQGFVAAFLR